MPQQERRSIWDWLIRRHEHRMLADSALLGVVGGLAARLFEFLLRLCQNVFLGGVAGYKLPNWTEGGSIHGATAGGHGPWLIPVSTALGGLLAGLIIYTLAPETEGHGTDSVVNAFHRLRGIIRARVPALKLVASALTIGSGGSAGREGPTALISAGVASVYARRRGRSEEETRLLLLVGMAAGLSAIFRSPIGTAIFAIEVLYGQPEFEPGALVYTMLASVVAYAVNGFFVGFRPLFAVPPNLPPTTVAGFGWYFLLGIASGVTATVLPAVFYRIRDLFRLIPCPPHVKPAIGGLLVGLSAILFPQLLGGGYTWMQSAIDGRIPGVTMLCLAAGKILTFAFTIGSGGSGGVFAPTLFTGAMLGGFLSTIVHQPTAAFAVVGMAAVFGGAARVPIATILMVTEMTGGYQLLVPAGLAVIVSYFVQTVLSTPLKYRSLYLAQVPTRADSPSHYTEQVRTALDLLNRQEFSAVSSGGLDLLPLFAAGVPVNLGSGNQLRIGTLRSDSSCVGQPSTAGCFGAKGDPELILAIRRGRVLRPNPEFRLEAGDRLVFLGSDAAWDGLAGHLEQPAVANGGPAQPPVRREEPDATLLRHH